MQETDGHLLKRFANHRDEAAFESLAARYLGLIFHTALRRTANRALAEEVSQNVLCAVAKKASSLARNPERLSAWLHRATLFESSKAMRSEQSQQRRKELRHPDQIASTTSENDSHWLTAQPHLDDALDHLSQSDRVVVLKHYFEGASFSRIGEQQSRPAATVQKQCRRAIDKLARILRGKGVALSAAVIASGLGTQLAKAAPVALLESATVTALGGSAAYSTTQLTLFMAMKSKALLPLTLLVILTPLGLQQLAISRATAENNKLRNAFPEQAVSARPDRSIEGASSTTAQAMRTITIDDLERARSEAQRRGMLKQIEFDEMLAALNDDELAGLIPQVFGLPVDGVKKRDLFRDLVAELAKRDPARAVKVAFAANPSEAQNPNSGVHRHLFSWASQSPDEAFDWFKGAIDGVEKPSWHGVMSFQGAIAGALILEESPRVRELISMTGMSPANLVRDGMGYIAPDHFLEPEVAVDSFVKFLPWIREFVPEESKSGYGRRQAIEGLLRECNSGSEWRNSPVSGKIMEIVDLDEGERLVVAETYTNHVLGRYYNTQPRPQREVLDGSARTWLEKYMPEEADTIFETTKIELHEREARTIERYLVNLGQREVLRDDDLVRELTRRDFGEFPELLPKAMELSQKIKDPVKRAETIQQISHP